MSRWTSSLLLAPARGRCDQAGSASLLDGLGAAARAELLVQVPLVRLNGIHRQVQLASYLPRRQVGRQVMQNPGLAVGQGLQVPGRRPR